MIKKGDKVRVVKGGIDCIMESGEVIKTPSKGNKYWIFKTDEGAIIQTNERITVLKK